MEIKTVTIVGLGALGIMYGNHFAKRMDKKDLRIIADVDRAKRYKKKGVFCNGESCDFNYVTPLQGGLQTDLLLFTVKSNGLQDAIKTVQGCMGNNTIILSALNGITSESIIGKGLGMEKVLYSVAQGMDAVRVDNKLKYQKIGTFCFGERESGIITDRVKKVAKFFDKVAFPYEVGNDMIRHQWGKFMLNVGLNQAVAIYGETFGDAQKEGLVRDAMLEAMKEVITLSQKEGVNLTEKDLTYWLNVLATINPDGKPSMRQDIEARRSSEVDIFAGTVLALGRKYSVQTPVNELFYNKIKNIECRYWPR